MKNKKYNSVSQRKLELDNIYNIRDLGGLTTTEHLTVFGKVLRGEAGYLASEEDYKYLLDYGIKYLFDLRTPKEISAVGYGKLNNFLKVSHPLISDNDFRKHSSLKITKNDEYFSYFNNSHQAIKSLVELILSDSGAVYIHCAVGKDRTGIISLILLKLLGVDNNEIINDYMLSQKPIERILPNLSLFDLYNDFKVIDWDRQYPKIENITNLLNLLSQANVVEEYLGKAQITHSQINDLKSLLLRRIFS